MKSKSVIILGVIAVGLVLYVVLDVWKNPGTTEIQRQARKVGRFKYTTIQRFEIHNPKGSFCFIKKNENSWEIEKPISFPADSGAVREALVEIEIAERLDTLKNIPEWNTALQQYGLKEPRIKVALGVDQKMQTLAIGRETPIPGTVYALLTDDQKREIVVIDQGLEEFLNKDLDAWRSHEVFNFFPDLITRIVAQKDRQEIELKKNEHAWEILKPLATAADAESVSKFLQETADIRAGQFVSESDTAQSPYGLATPSLVLEITDYKQKTYMLKIGSPTPEDANVLYASCTDRPAIFTLPKTTAESLGNILDKVRDRRVVSYPFTTAVQQLSIRFDGIHYQLQRKDKNTWYIANENHKAEFMQVDNFLGQLFALRALRYPPPVKLAAFGLAQPTAVVQWHANPASPNTHEAPSLKVKEETLSFGSTTGEEIYLQTPRQLSVVTVPKKILDYFPRQSWTWYSLDVLDFREEPIESITWTAQEKTCTVQAANGDWKLINEEGVINQRLLQLQLRILGYLKAVRWIGAAQRDDFAKPLLTISLKRGEYIDRLVFAKKLSDQTVLARRNDEPYAFVINERDFRALSLSPKQPNIPPDVESIKTPPAEE
ncbi:MAG: DUF4340 domain-containing protein [Verrucomicrobiota bacterium]